MRCVAGSVVNGTKLNRIFDADSICASWGHAFEKWCLREEEGQAFRSVLRCAPYTSQRRLTLEGITFDGLTPSLRTMCEHPPARFT